MRSKQLKKIQEYINPLNIAFCWILKHIRWTRLSWPKDRKDLQRRLASAEFPGLSWRPISWRFISMDRWVRNIRSPESHSTLDSECGLSFCSVVPVCRNGAACWTRWRRTEAHWGVAASWTLAVIKHSELWQTWSWEIMVHIPRAVLCSWWVSKVPAAYPEVL